VALGCLSPEDGSPDALELRIRLADLRPSVAVALRDDLRVVQPRDGTPACHLKIVRERAFVGGSRPNLAASAEPPNDDQRIVEADVPVFTREIPPSKSGMIQVLVANSKPSEAEDASCITGAPVLDQDVASSGGEDACDVGRPHGFPSGFAAGLGDTRLGRGGAHERRDDDCGRNVTG
jgi:hypothetical protein